MDALSELQLSLAVLALVFVAAVWIYNKWQEFGQRRAAKQIFGALAAGDPLAAVVAGQEAGRRIEPVMGDGAADTDSGEPPAPPLELADPGIDCLLRLTPREDLAAPVFWQAQQQHLAALADSLRWLAWHGGRWRQLGPHDAGACERFVAVLQLADRSGALGEVALTRLLVGCAALAESIGAEPELPAAALVLERAGELDRFCAGVDWIIGLQLVSSEGGALPGTRLIAALKEAGLEEADDGRMLAQDSQGQTQFVVSSLDASPLASDQDIPGLSLSIDVPVVSDGVAAFDRLLQLSSALMAALPAQLVDEQRSPLPASALAAIRAKIAEFQQKMSAAEIPAGGRRALRLYA